jgi:hypothetical protein
MFLLRTSFCISLSLLSFTTQGQEIKKNHLFIELFGNGLVYSVNYERTLPRTFTARIGVGAAWESVFVPVTFGKVFGHRNNHIEVGIGNTANIYQSKSSHQTEIALIATGLVGYRHTSEKKPLVFRLGFTPWYVYSDLAPNTSQDRAHLVLWGGISAGYVFK